MTGGGICTGLALSCRLLLSLVSSSSIVSTPSPSYVFQVIAELTYILFFSLARPSQASPRYPLERSSPRPGLDWRHLVYCRLRPRPRRHRVYVLSSFHGRQGDCLFRRRLRDHDRVRPVGAMRKTQVRLVSHGYFPQQQGTRIRRSLLSHFLRCRILLRRVRHLSDHVEQVLPVSFFSTFMPQST